MPSDNFLISVVIPSFNGRHLLEKNLPKIRQAVGESQIIVIDDASTDDTVSFLEKNHPDIICLQHKTNRRFAAACNTGVRAATGDIIILLNNDVRPEPDFLQPLINPFKNPKMFAVGCREYIEKNGQREYSGRNGCTFKRGLFVHWRCQDQSNTSTCWVAAGAAAYRRSLWLKLGGMDELFAPAYEEDRDISYRALKAGYDITFVPESLVHHQHETTNQTALGQTKMQLASYKNHLLFVWKNITSAPLMLQHLLWLPYHLTITSFKSRGRFLVGFLWALTQLPAVIKKRRLGRYTKQDETIISNLACS